MPSIPEFDNAPVSTKDGFMQYIESTFSDKISSYKSGLTSQLTDKLDPTKYLSSFGI
jgi:hypothetical protein